MVQKKDNASVRILGKGAAICSGKKTASETIHSVRCAMTSIILCTDGTNDASIVIQDGSGGTVLREFTISGSENFGGNAINYPVYASSGIDVTLTGTGAFYFIDYIRLEE